MSEISQLELLESYEQKLMNDMELTKQKLESVRLKIAEYRQADIAQATGAVAVENGSMASKRHKWTPDQVRRHKQKMRDIWAKRKANQK
jgi:hypothetical protein